MPRAVISGLGLIGGSIALALRARGWSIAYVDPAVPLDAARAAGAADQRLDELSDLRAEDVVVLATPVDVAIRTLQRLGNTHATVTSACSVMSPLRDAAPAIAFVAGHPFAGAERSGLSAARADLFAEKPWFVDAATNHTRVLPLIEACGAIASPVDAQRHDELVALTSHLPQLISTALASAVATRDVPPEFVGSGLRTLLRLASSPHAVWQPVIETNAAQIDAARELFEEALRKLARGDGAAEFRRANDFAATPVPAAPRER